MRIPSLVSFVALVSVSLVASAFAAESTRPNIVLIVADDLGYGELASYGGGQVPTPALDRIAKEGARFTQAYVTASYCAPSRAALLTGKYQQRFGFEGNPTGALNEDPRIGLPRGERTLAERLRASGYSTALIGKWHLGGTAPYHPQRRGFDEFFGFLHEGHYFVPWPWQGVTTWLRRTALPDGGKGRWTSPDGKIVWTTHMGHFEPDYDPNNPIVRNSQPIDERANLTDAFTREASDYIRRHAGQPFFLYLAYNAVHSPMQGDDRYMAKFAHIPDIHRRIFAAMLSQLDDGIGKIMDTLRSSGIDDRTLVVFISDNGGATRELTSSNAPLRGEKGQVYEGGIRVPMLLRWPNRIPAGTVFQQPVISFDITATALAAAGVTLKPSEIDGVNLLPALRDSAPLPERTFYWRSGKRAALRAGPWKLVRDRMRSDSAAWELYNLSSDLAEENNLAAREPARLAELTARWEAWSARMAAPAW